MQLPRLLPILVLPLAITNSAHSPASSSNISPRQVSNSAASIIPSPVDRSEQESSFGSDSTSACPAQSNISNSSSGCSVRRTQENSNALISSISSGSDSQRNNSISSLPDEDSEIGKKGEGGRGSSTKCWFSCSSDGARAVTPGRGLVVIGVIAGVVLL